MDDEYLYILETLDIPPVRLILKIGAPIILIRNMNPAKEFYNGIRYIVKRIYFRALKIEITADKY
jgi:hypothetical protein